MDLGEELNVITLDPTLEQMLIGSLAQSAQAGELIVEPSLIEGLIESVKTEKDAAENAGFPFVIVVAPPIRPWLARMLKQRFADVSVLAYTEIPEDQSIKVLARVVINKDAPENIEANDKIYNEWSLYLSNNNSLFETILVTANDQLVKMFLNNRIKFLDISKNLLKIINNNEFKKYKRITPRNVAQIEQLSNYVSLKIGSLSI